MSFASHFETVNLPKLERAQITWSEAVAHAISMEARTTELTGTWNASIQTFKDGDDIIIGPSLAVLNNHPLIKSSLDDGDYTVMFTERRQAMIRVGNGNKALLPKNFSLRSPLAISKGVGRVTDYL